MKILNIITSDKYEDEINYNFHHELKELKCDDTSIFPEIFVN